MEVLRAKRAFYRQGATFFCVARRVERGDRNALLLLVLEAMLPLIDPTSKAAAEAEAEDDPFAVVIDGAHFSEENRLPLLWFSRLRETLQPILQSRRLKKVWTLPPTQLLFNTMLRYA